MRTKASIIVTTGQAWSTHHFACLVGYGASAVVPYAAFDAVVNWHSVKRNQLAMERGDIPKVRIASYHTLIYPYLILICPHPSLLNPILP